MREEDRKNFSAAMAASKGQTRSRFLSSLGVGTSSSPEKVSRLPRSGSTTLLPPIGAIPKSTHSVSCSGDDAAGGGTGSLISSIPRQFGGKYVINLPLVTKA